MKKEKIVIVITIGIMSLLLACVMFMQFKVVNEIDVSELESLREDELQKLASEWKEKYEETNTKLQDTQTKIAEYKEKSENSDETEKLVEEELKEANLILGKTDVTGNGIQVTLKDTEDKVYDA